MKKLNNKELLNIKGGFSFSATMLNAFARIGNIILELGRSVGSSIRRLQTNNLC